MHVSKRGGRTELKSRQLEHKDQHDVRNDSQGIGAMPAVSTPERAGGRHRSPHGGDGADPLTTRDPWQHSHVNLSPAITRAKRR